MSYCRLPYMIYPTKKGVQFELNTISNDEIDVFLYKIFLTRRDEFIKRIKHGKEIIMRWQDDEVNENNYKDLIDFHKRIGTYSDKEIKIMLKSCKPSENSKNKSQEYKQWLLDKEDELFKKLIK